MSTIPPCAGLWALFDSTDPGDHARAAALCATCPIVDHCRRQLEAARADALMGEKNGVKYGPQGTWAGEAVGVTRVQAEKARMRAEEAMFTDDELRTGHADYTAGFRSPRTVMAERIYQRKRKQRQAAKKVAA